MTTTKTIHITVRDNNSDWFDTAEMVLTCDEYFDLRDYDSPRYDSVWDSLCDRLDKIYGVIVPDWYVDHISFR